MGKTFKGGVHPKEAKELSSNIAFETMPAPKEVILPIAQHIGKPSKVLVKKKDTVKKGQLIAEQDGFISASLHSPISGTVKSIGIMANVNGVAQPAIVIVANDSDETDYLPALDPETISPQEIRDRVKDAGIVGQGGAAFPTYVKLSPPPNAKIDSVILNGCECEPYLTRDNRFMIERTEDLMKGLKLLMKALEIKQGRIGIEDNKPEAIEILQKVASKYDDIIIDVVKTKYPQGAEKMLIKAAVNREVPPGKLPMDVGVVIQNIGTALAVYDAVVDGITAFTAALTVSGQGINQPKNLLVPIGTTIGDIIDFCGGVKEDKAKQVIVGGPMMGSAQHDMSAAIMKATSGILVFTDDEVTKMVETNCVKCGNCVSVCPMGLVPTDLIKYARSSKPDGLRDFGVMNCIECGSCQYNCPANIPLVHWLRVGKYVLRRDDIKQQKQK